MTVQRRAGSGRPVRLLAWRTLEGERRSFELPARDVRIGRNPEMDLCFPHGDVSRAHCTVLLGDDGMRRVRDDGSTGGTFVSGHRVRGERILEPGDVVRLSEFGQVELECRAAPEVDIGPDDDARGGRTETLRAILSVLSSTLDLDEVFALLLDASMKVTGLERGAVLISDADDGGADLTVRRSRGACSDAARRAARKARGTCASIVVRTPEGLDAVAVPMRAFQGDRLAINRDTGAWSSVGVILVEGRGAPEGVDDAAVALVQAACDVAAVHVAHARLLELARRDALTGLLNRGTFDLELARHASKAATRGTELALALLDIDRFKSINDTHGHVAGDQALRAVAEELRGVAGERAIAFRYGGEEMALLIPGEGLDTARELVEDARRRIEARNVDAAGKLGAVQLHLTFSAGVACWSDGRHVVPTDLVREADRRCLQAKSDGRNRVVWTG